MLFIQAVCVTTSAAERNQRGLGNSLAVQWLGLCAFIAEDAGSTPGQRTKIPQAM